jgi:oligosaccharide repeat unit polymerase
MELVIFNALLYVGALFIYWFIRRKIDAGFVLISVYTLVAILGIPLYITTANQWKITLWPYLYLFTVLMLFFRPYFFDSDSLYKRLNVSNNKVLKIISTLYIICAFIAIYHSMPQAIANIRSGEWLIIRNNLYAGDIVQYTGQTERIAKIFVQYLDIVAIVVLYYFLTLQNIKRLRIILLAIAVIIPTFLTSFIIASRGMLLNLFINLLLGYIIFQKEIPKNIKWAIRIFAISLLVIVFIFSLAVTISRFGESDQSSSLLLYFAHSFMTFNYGVADSIQNYAGGRYFFNWFYDILGLNSTINFNQLGTHFDTAFITFVGTLYIDFGPIGTFLIALFVPIIISRSFRYKKTVDIADIYMFTFYLSYLVNGIFIVGRGNSLSWIMAALIYIILKIMQLKNISHKRVSA